MYSIRCWIRVPKFKLWVGLPYIELKSECKYVTDGHKYGHADHQLLAIVFCIKLLPIRQIKNK